jgi:hypothetical protein
MARIIPFQLNRNHKLVGNYGRVGDGWVCAAAVAAVIDLLNEAVRRRCRLWGDRRTRARAAAVGGRGQLG